ncbi:MAG: hypothetical protein Q9157_006015 [Trypethelium eluteriae]
MRLFWTHCARLSSTAISNQIQFIAHRSPSGTYHRSHVRNVSTINNRQRPVRFTRLALIILTSSAVAGYLFRAFVKSDRTSTWDTSSFLDPHSFRTFTLVAKDPVTSTSSIFCIRPTNGELDAKRLQELWDSGIWSVQIKQPQLQIVRAYTPLPPDLGAGNGQENDASNELRFLIRKEESGEVSGYLHRLPTGSQIEVRRANVEYQLPPNATEVLFLAGGTGIAPAMQLAFATLRRPSTRNHIMWANRRREDCMGAVSPADTSKRFDAKSWLPGAWGPSNTRESRQSVSHPNEPNAIVRQLRHYEKASKKEIGQTLSVESFVDDEQSFITPDRIKSFLNSGVANHKDEAQPLRQILVAGPDGFVAHWAGKKPIEGSGDPQGPLGGILSQLDTRGWRVWKL